MDFPRKKTHLSLQHSAVRNLRRSTNQRKYKIFKNETEDEAWVKRLGKQSKRRRLRQNSLRKKRRRRLANQRRHPKKRRGRKSNNSPKS
jgi:hypothetical protein